MLLNQPLFSNLPAFIACAPAEIYKICNYNQSQAWTDKFEV